MFMSSYGYETQMKASTISTSSAQVPRWLFSNTLPDLWIGNLTIGWNQDAMLRQQTAKEFKISLEMYIANATLTLAFETEFASATYETALHILRSLAISSLGM